MAKIANMIDSITGADEEAQKQKEQFSFLQKMALAKCEEFKSDLEKTAFGDKSKIEIGGGRFFKYYSGYFICCRVENGGGRSGISDLSVSSIQCCPGISEYDPGKGISSFIYKKA